MDRREADFRQTVPAAISGLTVDRLVLRGRMPPGPVHGGDWFHCDGGAQFRIVRLGHRPVRMDASDGPAMAALLDAADRLLSAIEAALDLRLLPRTAGPAANPGPLVAIDGAEIASGEIDTSIELLLPDTMDKPASVAPLALALVGHVSVRLRISVDGPRLAPAEAAGLQPGDLLLLAAGPLMARIDAGVGPAVSGRLYPAERLFRAEPSDPPTATEPDRHGPA
jgi:hypothetical protein